MITPEKLFDPMILVEQQCFAAKIKEKFSKLKERFQ